MSFAGESSSFAPVSGRVSHTPSWYEAAIPIGTLAGIPLKIHGTRAGRALHRCSSPLNACAADPIFAPGLAAIMPLWAGCKVFIGACNGTLVSACLLAAYPVAFAPSSPWPEGPPVSAHAAAFMYFGKGFAFLTLVLDGPILIGALPRRASPPQRRGPSLPA